MITGDTNTESNDLDRLEDQLGDYNRNFGAMANMRDEEEDGRSSGSLPRLRDRIVKREFYFLKEDDKNKTITR